MSADNFILYMTKAFRRWLTISKDFMYNPNNAFYLVPLEDVVKQAGYSFLRHLTKVSLFKNGNLVGPKLGPLQWKFSQYSAKPYLL